MSEESTSDMRMESSNRGDVSFTSTWDGQEPPSSIIVNELSDTIGVDPMEMPPLYHSVDPDALDTLLTTAASNDDHAVTVSFEHEGHSVTISSDGSLAID